MRYSVLLFAGVVAARPIAEAEPQSGGYNCNDYNCSRYDPRNDPYYNSSPRNDPYDNPYPRNDPYYSGNRPGPPPPNYNDNRGGSSLGDLIGGILGGVADGISGVTNGISDVIGGFTGGITSGIGDLISGSARCLLPPFRCVVKTVVVDGKELTYLAEEPAENAGKENVPKEDTPNENKTT